MAKRRRRRLDPLRALTEQELRRQANQLVAAQLLGPKQEIRRARAEARRQAEADAKAIQGFTTALAGIVGQAGPAVDKVYADATTRQAGIAQGFANQQRQIDQASADQMNALIAAQGGTRRIDPGTGSTVTYALGGKIPADLLNQTGAAMSSIAHGYGAGVAGRGQMQLQARQAQAKKELARIDEAMEELMAKVPGLSSEILDKLYQREISKAATRIQGGYLGLAGQREAFDQSYDTARLAQDAAQAAQKAAGDKGKANAKAREARMKALAVGKEKAWDLAATLAAQTRNVPGVGEQPNPPTPQKAFDMLWARYGSGLMQYAPAGHKPWWRRQVTAMIWNALTSNGFKRPVSSKKRNRAVAPNNRKITRPGPS